MINPESLTGITTSVFTEEVTDKSGLNPPTSYSKTKVDNMGKRV